MIKCEHFVNASLGQPNKLTHFTTADKTFRNDVNSLAHSIHSTLSQRSFNDFNRFLGSFISQVSYETHFAS